MDDMMLYSTNEADAEANAPLNPSTGNRIEQGDIRLWCTERHANDSGTLNITDKRGG